MIKIKFGEPGIQFSQEIEQKLKEILNITDEISVSNKEE